MKVKYILITILIFLACGKGPNKPDDPIIPPGEWETFEVPGSRGIHSIAADSSGILYAGIWMGDPLNTAVYRSLDFGETWNRLYSFSDFYGVTELQVIDNQLYAGTASIKYYGSVNIYVDGDLTWILPNSHKTLQITKIDNHLYATTGGLGLMFELMNPFQYDSLKVGESYDQHIHGLFEMNGTLYAYTGGWTASGYIYQIVDHTSILSSTIRGCGGHIFWIERANDLFLAGTSIQIWCSSDVIDWTPVLTFSDGVSRDGIYVDETWWIAVGSKLFKSTDAMDWVEDELYPRTSLIKQIINFRNIIYIASSEKIGPNEFQGVIHRFVFNRVE